MNKYCEKINRIDDIPDIEFEGYIWMSDESTPRKIRAKSEIPAGMENPFIVEGFLKSANSKTSISLTSINGLLNIFRFNLELIQELPENWKTKNSYLTHRYNDARIEFITVWLPSKDELCEGMEVLHPILRVFNGFKSKI